ncbi:hypothetical protein U9M48_017965 [Paspalum notatum var. saurae]|uniref:Uncharacterized protein n=1 Tax=Paspalum notatum var. saurae TaxID=547442 RepID=A0AAQ3T900_PASNO
MSASYHILIGVTYVRIRKHKLAPGSLFLEGNGFGGLSHVVYTIYLGEIKTYLKYVAYSNAHKVTKTQNLGARFSEALQEPLQGPGSRYSEDNDASVWAAVFVASLLTGRPHFLSKQNVLH